MRQSLGDPRPHKTQEPRKPSIWSGSTPHNPCHPPRSAIFSLISTSCLPSRKAPIGSEGYDLPPFKYHLTIQILIYTSPNLVYLVIYTRLRPQVDTQSQTEGGQHPVSPQIRFTLAQIRGWQVCLCPAGKTSRDRASTQGFNPWAGWQPPPSSRSYHRGKDV